MKLKMINEEFPDQLSSKALQKGFRQPKILSQPTSVRSGNTTKIELPNSSRSQYVKQISLPLTGYTRQAEKFIEALLHRSSNNGNFPDTSQGRK